MRRSPARPSQSVEQRWPAHTLLAFSSRIPRTPRAPTPTPASPPLRPRRAADILPIAHMDAFDTFPAHLALADTAFALADSAPAHLADTARSLALADTAPGPTDTARTADDARRLHALLLGAVPADAERHGAGDMSYFCVVA
ncbi:hypothetical protein HDZ31DRAFT_66099 [Schizophyllum fasciatum]